MDTSGGLPRLAIAQPLRDRAYDAIKEAILSLSLKPGEPLVERNLATRLGISKTPIRGALVRLEREGLVTMAPFKGTIVAHIHKDDIREIFELREALESLAARQAASVLTDDELREAERALDIADEAFRAGRYAECSRIGHAIHDLAIRRADNKRLSAIVRNLDDHLQRYRLVSAQIPGRLARSNQEHRDILAALYGKDASRAEQLMKGHLQGVLIDLMTQDDVAPSDDPDSLPVTT